MQRTFLIGLLSVSFTLASASYAQNHSGYGGGGLGHAPVLAPIGSVGRAPIVPPFGRSTIGSGGYGNGSYGRRGYGYGYGIGAYPVYIGAFSGDYYPGYTDPSLGNGGSYPAAAPPAPPVVINQYFGAPPSAGPAPEDSDIQMYSQPAPSGQTSAPAAAEPRTYLIAYKDHSVYSALAYWVEDHTLHYVTTQNTHNQADVNLIDVDFTRKLNTDRNMPFSLTPAQRN